MVTKKTTTTVAKSTKTAVKSVTAKDTPAKVTKKPIKKEVGKSKNTLTCAPSEKCFWVTDGKVLADIVELRDALASMSDDVFAYHVSKGKNDFADWIEQVFEDVELATSLRKTKKPQTAHHAVISRLRIYSV